MLYDEVRFLPAGEAALVVEFADEVSPEANARVYALRDALRERPLPGLGEAVPTYRSLLLHFEPLALDPERLRQHVARLLRQCCRGDPASEAVAGGSGAGRRVASAPGGPEAADAVGEGGAPANRRPRLREIPVVYGGEMGPDLPVVAELTGLSEEAVVRLHSETVYTVYMVGFLPGFPYLGLLPPALETPRLREPRLVVPAGSVAIAGRQTGIYPMESPGGWRILGRTPLRLFDPSREPPAYVAPGDRVRFVPVAAADFARLAEEQLWP